MEVKLTEDEVTALVQIFDGAVLTLEERAIRAP
jgi:hypothetical protein